MMEDGEAVRPAYANDPGNRSRFIDKPRLLILSHVVPLSRSSGQQQRVFYTLEAARRQFHVTFACPVATGTEPDVAQALSKLCDELVFLPSWHSFSKGRKAFVKAIGAVYCLVTGLKFSNYIIGRVDFPPGRVSSLVASESFDCVLFEYWHAVASARRLRDRNIPCVLDMHDILWRARAQELSGRPGFLGQWNRWSLGKYRSREELAWRQFDALIAINRDEHQYVKSRLPEEARVFYAPMGIELSRWPYSWEPARPARVCYYGGFGGRQNQEAAQNCFAHVMARVWEQMPETELWLVGSNPPKHLQDLSRDPRVKVTGFVKDVQELLSSMSVVVCPWSGRYGFRSRLVEVMALGVPVVCSPDAVHGMDLKPGKGLLYGYDSDEMASQALRLLRDGGFGREQSRFARQQVERLFSMENTYWRLIDELNDWLDSRQAAKPLEFREAAGT
jgi:glycosyltransferase involved in cell wall biosynthesis